MVGFIGAIPIWAIVICLLGFIRFVSYLVIDDNTNMKETMPMKTAIPMEKKLLASYIETIWSFTTSLLASASLTFPE